MRLPERCELHLASGRTLLMRTTLVRLAERLAAGGFLRVHRSRLVNPAAVTRLENLPAGDASLRMINGAEISVSRSAWCPLPNEVDLWWRQRSQMELVSEGAPIRVRGPFSERAVVAYASIKNGRLVYEVPAVAHS